MEWSLIYLTNLFAISTGILISWGIFSVSLVLYWLITHSRVRYRLLNTAFCIIVSMITLVLASLLFIYPDIASQNIFTLISLQFWYAIFAVFYTVDQLKPICNKLK